MLPTHLLILLLLLGTDVENPWVSKAVPIIEAGRADNASVEQRKKAMDAAWRADAWQAAAELAAAAVQSGESPLRGKAARALWRAGKFGEAEQLIDATDLAGADAPMLSSAITAALARGRTQDGLRLADRLEALENVSASDLMTVVGARFMRNRLDGLPRLIRKVETMANPKNGYPEIHIPEYLEGLAAYFESIGPAPVNRLDTPGTAPIEVARLVNLPMVEATINGHGPFRFILDTGGSIMVSIDSEVAEDIGLKTIVTGSVRGVSGKDSAGQALIDEFQIGSIRLSRVMSRVFEVRKAAAGSCDGIIGTGIFADARMKADLVALRLHVTPSSADPGVGDAMELRLIGDAKMIVPIRLSGRPATALLDSGADVAAISPATLAAVFPGKEFASMAAPMAGVGTGNQPTLSFAKGVDIEIGGRKYENFSGLGLDVLDHTLSPMLGMHIDALIGMPVFRDMKSFTVDFPRAKLWVDWAEKPESARKP